MSEVMITGSFDPITLGHMDIIKRAAELFSSVAVVMFINPEKEYMFTLEQRFSMIKSSCEKISGVRVDYSEGMVVDYVKDHNIKAILRGVRNAQDYEYEKQMALFNKINGGVETIFLSAKEELEHCSSTLARRMIKNGEIPKGILPQEIIEMPNRPF